MVIEYNQKYEMELMDMTDEQIDHEYNCKFEGAEL